MRNFIFLAALTVLYSAPPVTSSYGASPEVTLTVGATPDSYVLAVPVSRLVMTIPKGGLVPLAEPKVNASASPRYFHFEDRANGVEISGWYESAVGYQGFEKFWASETSAWKKKNLPAPLNESTQKVDNWDAVIYDLPMPGGTNTHIRSEWIQLNTWIDLHISVTTNEPVVVARKKALDILTSIKVSEAP